MKNADKIDKIKQLITKLERLISYDDFCSLEALELKTSDYINRFSTKEENKNLLIRNFPDLQNNSDEISLNRHKNTLIGLLDLLIEHISDDINQPQLSLIQQPNSITNKVFIVHGHDNTMELEVTLFLKNLGLKAILLHEQNNCGNTLIEKFEVEANKVSYAIVLFSPDDEIHKNENINFQPRPNVIFELGYFIAKLGRNKVSVLKMKGNDTTIPSDILGLAYTEYEPQNESWKLKVKNELTAAGYILDPNQ